jgi:hypothetical protein
VTVRAQPQILVLINWREFKPSHGLNISKLWREDSRTGAAITLTKCPRCARAITSEDEFCPACGMVLDAKVAVQLEDERAKADSLMDLLMRDDEVRSLLSRKIHELYSSPQHHPS